MGSSVEKNYIQLDVFGFISDTPEKPEKTPDVKAESEPDTLSERGIFKGLHYQGGEIAYRRLYDISVKRHYDAKTGNLKWVVSTGGFNFGYNTIEKLCSDWGIKENIFKSSFNL